MRLTSFHNAEGQAAKLQIEGVDDFS